MELKLIFKNLYTNVYCDEHEFLKTASWCFSFKVLAVALLKYSDIMCVFKIDYKHLMPGNVVHVSSCSLDF